MGSHLAQVAFVHDQNAIGALDGGKAVRNHDRRPSFHQAIERLAHAQFGLGVDARGGFVQNQEARIVRQRAGKADQLFLPRREAGPALAHRLVETIGQPLDKIEQVDTLRRADQLIVADPLGAESNIAGNGAGE